MPSTGTMAYYPAFPPAIRLSGVGCIRVAHPCATLRAPEGAHPVRLACIRPAASVHPEPGSNSSLYYCFTQISILNLGFRLDVLFGVPLLKGSLPRAASQWRWSCAGLRLSKNFAFSLQTIPSFLPKAGAKVLPFPELASTFFIFFRNIFYVIEY